MVWAYLKEGDIILYKNTNILFFACIICLPTTIYFCSKSLDQPFQLFCTLLPLTVKWDRWVNKFLLTSQQCLRENAVRFKKVLRSKFVKTIFHEVQPIQACWKRSERIV